MILLTASAREIYAKHQRFSGMLAQHHYFPVATEIVISETPK